MLLSTFILFIVIVNKCSYGNDDGSKFPLNDTSTEPESISSTSKTWVGPLVNGCSDTINFCCCNYTACFFRDEQTEHLQRQKESKKSPALKNLDHLPKDTSDEDLSPQTTEKIHPFGTCDTCTVCVPQKICCPNGRCCSTGCSPTNGCA